MQTALLGLTLPEMITLGPIKPGGARKEAATAAQIITYEQLRNPSYDR